jgi:hypothetical protein
MLKERLFTAGTFKGYILSYQSCGCRSNTPNLLECLELGLTAAIRDLDTITRSNDLKSEAIRDSPNELKA